MNIYTKLNHNKLNSFWEESRALLELSVVVVAKENSSFLLLHGLCITVGVKIPYLGTVQREKKHHKSDKCPFYLYEP